MTDKVIFCSICGFCTFKIKKLVHHLESHFLNNFFCGVDQCSLVFRDLGSFKEHLASDHIFFYPEILSANITLNDNSVFSTRFQNPDNLENDIQINSLSPSENCLEDNVSNSLDHDQTDIRKFLELLSENGCKNNLSFKSMKNLSSTLINFCFELSEKGSFNEDLRNILLNVINTPERFDTSLESYLNAVMPEKNKYCPN